MCGATKLFVQRVKLGSSDVMAMAVTVTMAVAVVLVVAVHCVHSLTLNFFCCCHRITNHK